MRFYSLGVYEQELKFCRSTLHKVRQIEREGKYGNIAFTQEGQLELLSEFGGMGIKAYDCSETVIGIAGYV